MIRKAIILYLVIMIILPPLTAGAVTIPGFYGTVRSPLRAVGPTQLPVLRSPNEKIKDGEYVIDDTTTPNRMVINQQRDKIVVDWNSFDIGSSASVHFDQRGNTSWAALNRIWDASPSQIYGRLTADGRIYLINQNGILFAPGAQVNTHTLIASSLNLSRTDFMSNALKFNRNQEPGEIFYDVNNIPGTDTNPGVVTNLGTITTKDQGSVFLIGPNVENGGTIEANLGQIGLVAGNELELVAPVDGDSPLSYPNSGAAKAETRTQMIVKMTRSPEGTVAWNMEGASLGADKGLVGMYGGIVNQDGLIRSVTAVQQAGHVELLASRKISTGTNSWIATPVSTSPERLSNVDSYQSTIIFSGIDILTAEDPPRADPRTYAQSIEHRGRIDAPWGYVQLNAVDRVYLESGSAIDVSGLWIDKSASAQVLKASMTSVNLRDAFMQKNGILKGATITMGALTGSAIGDVSGSLSQGFTAVESHTQGGNIVVSLVRNQTENNRSATGDFILRQGATIDFSGGGFRYAAGAAGTTKLVSGNKIYDIATASPSILYDRIMNTQTVDHKRYGITDRYEGIYYGGVIPLENSLPAHTEGSNAGSFTIGARQAVLDGTLRGQVEKGIYQYMTANPQGKSGYGEPLGGELFLGNTTSPIQDNENLDRYFKNIVVTGQALSILSSGFTAESDLSSISVLAGGKTVISSVALSGAGLSRIYLGANETVNIAGDARIILNPGQQQQKDSKGVVTTKTATFEAVARRIEHYGSIEVPGGDIRLGIEENMTTPGGSSSANPVQLNERIYLADGSALIVRGERIDNRTLASPASAMFGAHTTGGNVSIVDKSVTSLEGIAVSKGALIDVSGGWFIDRSGKVSGGDAGSLMFRGYSLFIDGDLRGHSLTGKKGGTVSLHAGDVLVAAASRLLPNGFTADSPWPDGPRGQLVLGSGRFDKTGFTNIDLKSVADIIIDGNLRIAPSLTKVALPGSTATWINGALTLALQAEPAMITANRDDLGATSITLTANALFSELPSGDRYRGYYPMNTDHPDAVVKVPRGAIIETAPGGTISMNGPVVHIYGTINAPAGTIGITSTKDLNLYSGAQVLAEGYNKLSAAPLKTLPLEYTPLPGGTVTLKNGVSGLLNLYPGSLISVAGSSPVKRAIVGEGGTVSYIADAGKAGAINLTGRNVLLDGTLKGRAGMEGLQGGSLAITKTDSGDIFSVFARDLAHYRNSGFDALTLASEGELYLNGPMDMAFDRSLTLNARTITGSGSISLSAPWMRVIYRPTVIQTTTLSPSSGNAALRLTGAFLDVTGDVLLSGFSNVYLQAARDMRFTDWNYNNTWKGSLRTAGDLTLQAARIYPTTQSAFTIETAGKTTILPSGGSTAGPIYSAAGSFAIKAGGGIEHRGYIAAPMGGISLDAIGTGLGGRVYLADGSVVSTRGDIAVKYGEIKSDKNNSWIISDKTNSTDVSVQNAPDKSIFLKGEDVVVRQGSVVNISGGGDVFSYQFFASPSGTNNPLGKDTKYGDSTRWVIMPDNSIVLPGSAVYLAGGNALKAGVYSLLPEEYAFQPGAMILTDLKMNLSAAKPTRTKEGYAIVAGYETTMGTGINPRQMKGYELRSASDVLKEGSFITKTLTAGGGGALTIIGANAAIIDGSMRAAALPGYKTGGLYVGGNRVILQSSVPPIPGDFGFSSVMPANLAGTANISASLLAGNTFGTIGLGYYPTATGDHIVATEVTLKEGTILEAETIKLAARDRITLETGARALAFSSGERRGEITFNSPSGEVVISENAVVHVSDAINLDTTNLNLHPRAVFMSDHSTLNLTGPRITFVQDGYNRSASDVGLFLTQTQFTRFGSAFESIGLKSKSDLVFDGDFTLSVADILTLDAGLLRQTLSGSSVQLAAPTINTLNTGATPSVAGGARGTGTIAFTAASAQDSTGGDIFFGKGTVLFSGFAGVGLNAQNDLVFRGINTLKTGNADLNIVASRVTTSYYNDSGVYTAGNSIVEAGTGRVGISRTTGGRPGSDSTPGNLKITADSIDVSTLIEIPSGQLKLTAANNITLNVGGELRVRGTEYAPGGDVMLTSTGIGAISIAGASVDASGAPIAAALIDVSAGNQGDAGSVNLYAPAGGVRLDGNILGGAATRADGSSGLGSSLYMTTSSLGIDTATNRNLFSALIANVLNGGFNETLNIRTTAVSSGANRAGDIVIAGTASDRVRARNVKITADGGSISVPGAIDASQTGKGGTVELNAGQNLTHSGTITAQGTGTNASGGDILLGADRGALAFNNGSTIDVSGTGTGTGGKVAFQGSLSGTNNDQLNVNLNGRVSGASGVYVNAVRTYTGHSIINSAVIDTIRTNTSTFMNSAAAANMNSGFAASLGLDPTLVHLRPNVVVAGAGDLTLNSDLVLANGSSTSWRYSGETGTFTLRAAGNLNLNSNIIDNPTNNYRTLTSRSMQDSWGFNFVAGADTASADVIAVKPAGTQGMTTGNLNIALGKVVYTEKGSIRFSSGGDTTINEGPTTNGFMTRSAMQYALATYGGPITGNVEGGLNLRGGVIQSALGGIDIRSGGNLLLDMGNSSSYRGTIRTMGEYPSDKLVDNYYSYNGGGNINLRVGGNVSGALSNYWLTTVDDPAGARNSLFRGHKLLVPFYNTRGTEGIAALAGGGVYIRSGGGFDAQTGAFGAGDLRVYSGGDLRGRFLIKRGTGELSSAANFGAPDATQLIEMSDARVSVAAQGKMEIGAILNPALLQSGANFWDNQYTVNSSVKLTAVTGDVNMYGQIETGDSRYGSFYGTLDNPWKRYLPANMQIQAGRDIAVQNAWVLMPSPTGELNIQAGRDIAFTSGTTAGSIIMSDADASGRPYTVYGNAWRNSPTTPFPDLINSHGAVIDAVGNDAPLHYYDNGPVYFSAGRDINNMTVTLPKQAAIDAGRDILSLAFDGMNTKDSDLTRIFAARDILYGYGLGESQKRIQVKGPGYLVIQAGGVIDLGNTLGITTIGNAGMANLSSQGASAIVAAGIPRDLEWNETVRFFDSLRNAGDEYSTLLAAGDKTGAQQKINDARAGIIAPLVGSVNEGAGINMTSSQISTTAGGDLFIFTTGKIDVGKSAIGSAQTGASQSNSTDDKKTGVFTAMGGGINIFARGDVNVNEARVMTFMGGDITVWSDAGSINAGRGSRTAISTTPPRSFPVTDAAGNTTIVTLFQIPTVGSGIRAMTYDPDGAGPLTAPEAGILYIFAPTGTIDAGEAGMGGRSAVMGASQVLNTQNMSFSQGAVGMPAQSQSVNLGSLGGTGLAGKETMSAGVETLSNKVDSNSADSTKPIMEMLQRLEVRVISYELSLDAE